MQVDQTGDDDGIRVLRNWMKQRIAEGRRSQEQLAVDFLRIEEPLSYHCRSSQLTATDFLDNNHRLSSLGTVERFLIAYNKSPPASYQRNAEYAWRLNFAIEDHIDECRDCEAFRSVLDSYERGFEPYRKDLSLLLRKPFGMDAWFATVAYLRHDGYSNFHEYLAQNPDRYKK